MIENLLRLLHAEMLLILGTSVLVWLHRSRGGRSLRRPLVLLATAVHELAHGVAALISGADFQKMEIYRDGSGVAWWHGRESRFRSGFVSSAGYLGTATTGALLIALRDGPIPQEMILQVFGLALLLSAGLYVRNGFGIATVAALGGGIAAGGLFLPWPLLGLVCCVLGAGLWYEAWTSLARVRRGTSSAGDLGVAGSDAHKVASLYGGTHRLWATTWMGLTLIALMCSIWVG